jgi:hypothetical protein
MLPRPHGTPPSLRSVPRGSSHIRVAVNGSPVLRGGMRASRSGCIHRLVASCIRVSLLAVLALLAASAARYVLIWMHNAHSPKKLHNIVESRPISPIRHNASLDAAAVFINALAATRSTEPCPCAVIVTTLACSADDLDTEVFPWLSYHTEIGFRLFYVLWDGEDEAARTRLASLHNVVVVRLRPGPGHDAAVGYRYRAFAQNHWQWRNRPGNYVLMIKQGFAVNEAIRAAKVGQLPFQLPESRTPFGWDLNSSWLFHMDVDEAFVPQASDAKSSRWRGELRVESVLVALDTDVTSARFLNWEGVPPHERVSRRLAEVTVFKAHGRHIDARVWTTFSDQLKPPGHPEWPVFLLYGNGKPAARLSTPWLRQWGPHFFKGGSTHPLKTDAAHQRRLLQDGRSGSVLQDAESSDFEDDSTVDDANSTWKEVEVDSGIILHFPYARFSDMRSKAARSCPFGEAAASGNRSAVDACYVMGFDADVYMAAHSPNSDAELATLFAQRISLPTQLVSTHLRTGLLRRERAPAAVLAAHAREIAWIQRGWLPPNQEAQESEHSDGWQPGAFAQPEELFYLAFHM